ncbi:MAG: ArnT family glycosyltransferase [Anaerolineae bacterium]
MLEKANISRQDTFFWLALIGILAAFFIWELSYVGEPRWDYDEGVHTMAARLVRSGYSEYSEVSSLHPPLFISSFALAFTLFGNSLAVARTLVLVYSLIGRLSVALVARKLAGDWAGLAAATLLSFAPGFFLYSWMALADGPAVSLAVLSLLLALHYWESGKRGELIAAGLALWASFMLKLLTLFVIPLLALLVVFRYIGPAALEQSTNRREWWRALGTDLGLLAASLLLPSLPILLIYDLPSLYEQVIATLWDMRRVYPLDMAQNWRKVFGLLGENWGLSILALYGGLLLLLRRFRPALPVGLWLALALLAVTNNAPLRSQHLVVLFPPLAILGGVAVGETLHQVRATFKPSRWGAKVKSLAGLALMALYLVSLPGLIATNSQQLSPQKRAKYQDVTHFLSEATQPSDLIITDNQWIVFAADRETPPPLSDTGNGRLKSGHLTAEELVDLTVAYQPQAILVWGGRFVNNVPSYVEWVESNYQVARFYGRKRAVYMPPASPPLPEYTFGGQILFLGYDPDTVNLRDDGTLTISLYWRALRPVERDYRIYLKLINGAYHVWGQQDARPFWDGFPTNEWEVDQIVFDPREIPVLPGTPPGSYQLAVSLYDPYRGQALELDSGAELLLEPIEIPRREPPSLTSLDIAHPQKVILGDKVRLLGYNMESGFRPGDGIHLTLFWQCLEEMDRDYTVFTHLIDEQGIIWGQKDNPPVDGFYPTSQWEMGEIVRDQYDIAISPEALPGEYQLEVGMYLAETGERLSVIEGEQEAGNRVLLASEIRVE